MKKLAAFITAVFMLVTLAACGSSASVSSENYLKAVVVSMADGTLKVSANNQELAFSDKELAAAPELAAGDKVFLTYTGTIKDADTSAAHLTAVALVAEPQSEQAEEPAQSEEVVEPDYTKTATFYGMVKNASMNNFTVENGNGMSADFHINDNTVFSTIDGFLEGIMVTVTYTGNYKDAKTCNVISVAEDANNVTPKEDEAASSSSSSAAPSGDVSSLVGTISEASMSNLVIDAQSGEQIVFFLDDSTKINIDGGIALGKTVTVVYTGKLDGNNANSCTVVSVTG